jgi:hypothetical protein
MCGRAWLAACHLDVDKEQQLEGEKRIKDRKCGPSHPTLHIAPLPLLPLAHSALALLVMWCV